jgi:DNA-binding XRE family transcriptional regulator
MPPPSCLAEGSTGTAAPSDATEARPTSSARRPSPRSTTTSLSALSSRSVEIAQQILLRSLMGYSHAEIAEQIHLARPTLVALELPARPTEAWIARVLRDLRAEAAALET